MFCNTEERQEKNTAVCSEINRKLLGKAVSSKISRYLIELSNRVKDVKNRRECVVVRIYLFRSPTRTCNLARSAECFGP